MHDEPVGVSILTNGNRLESLQGCITSLLSNCAYRPLIIGIYDNGSTDDTRLWLENSLPEVYGVKWRYKSSDVDKGCPEGTNAAGELVQDCEFVLHVESDFEHIPKSMTGEDRMWLHRSLDFMRGERDCSYLYLRRMVDESSIYYHAWAQWMPKIDKIESSFMHCPEFWWSNNPHLRRTSTIYKAGCLPLDTSLDGPKGTPKWSQAELRNTHPPNVWIHKWGLFVHEKWKFGDLSMFSGCLPDPRVPIHCKYGFFKDGRDLFCETCDRCKSFSDMPEHYTRFCKKRK